MSAHHDDLILKTVFLCIVTLLATLAGCNGDYEEQLPGRLTLLRTNGSTTVIMRGQSTILVAAKVMRLGICSDDSIVGFVEPSPTSEVANLENPGWFIIFPDGSVEKGLSEATLDTKLKAAGLERPYLRRLRR